MNELLEAKKEIEALETVARFPESGMSKIYVFSAAPDGGESVCYALAEDGTCLGSHYCSDENYALIDLGVQGGHRRDRHETYRAHYPDGYEMEFIHASDLDSHEGFNVAFERNKAKAASQPEEVPA